jgi:hypothetical protein
MEQKLCFLSARAPWPWGGRQGWGAGRHEVNNLRLNLSFRFRAAASDVCAWSGRKCGQRVSFLLLLRRGTARRRRRPVLRALATRYLSNNL